MNCLGHPDPLACSLDCKGNLALAINRPTNREEMKISESVLEEENLFVLCRSLLNANEFVYFDWLSRLAGMQNDFFIAPPLRE